ncbi:hypothetical protein [Shewanella sp.]|jgi:hypothetical protein|uniref:hypothetical protein n=1 Tax=Shewanella sp. TaxID=50422 RepID=UPI003565C3D3
MLVQIFVALGKHNDEVIVLGVGSNSRLVEIQKESFMAKEDHVDWESQTQTHQLEIAWKENKEAQNAISEEKTIPDERKDIHAEISGKDEVKITKDDMVF